MSVAVCLKVNEGVILAADSAATLAAQTPGGLASVVNVYNNANKITNLRKGFPIGVVTYGSGNIGARPISLILKNLRERFTEDGDWKLKKREYTLERVVARAKEYLYDDLYCKAYKDWPQKPTIGFVFAGYSPGNDMAEEYSLEVQNGDLVGPELIRQQNDVGVTWRADGEAIHRLVMGYSPDVQRVLRSRLGVPEDQLGPVLDVLSQNLTAQIFAPAMPVRDAIDLAEFLVDLTIKFRRFTPGAPTVGGPIEVAAITKHEGFKWILRKHYYPAKLNPPPQTPRSEP